MMRILRSRTGMIVVLAIALGAPAPAAAVAPEVTDVVAVQREGSFLVDIAYDLADVDSDSLWISVLFSTDGGANFARICRHVSGDVGAGVSPGPGKTIVWEARKDVPGLDIPDAVVRVRAEDTPINPFIASWWRAALWDTVPFAAGDTIAYGEPLTLMWHGHTSSIADLSPGYVAEIDTIYPFDDGLLGYKWQLLGELGGNCVPDLEDCWHPRRFNEATGDSFSYFGTNNVLVFRNDGSSTTDPFRRLLPSGTVALRVNTIDIFDQEILPADQEFSFVVNHDPETIVLDGETDWAHPEDSEVYPYYVLLNDPEGTHVPFQSGDVIPDRAYVVVKALARDDPRDVRLDPADPVNVRGWLAGELEILTGGRFGFATDGSDPEWTPAWDASPEGWYGDTLGFLIGPRTTYTVNLQGIDEHGRLDGTPAQLSFATGSPPCVQCVELLPKTSSPSAWGPDLACADPPVGGHPCFVDTTIVRVSQNGLAPDELQFVRPAYLAVAKSSGFTTIVDDTLGLGWSNYIVDARVYRLTILLHGQDDARERWSEPLRRVGAWRYQVDYGCDPYNTIRDGGGVDDIGDVTSGDANGDGPDIDAATGLWRLNIDVAVPTLLLTLGPDNYRQYLLYVMAPGDPTVADLVFAGTTRQTGRGTVRAVALDQAACGFAPLRPATYNVFRRVRPPLAALPAGRTWRDCDLLAPEIKARIPLASGAMESAGGVAVTKHFRIVVATTTGDFACGD